MHNYALERMPVLTGNAALLEIRIRNLVALCAPWGVLPHPGSLCRRGRPGPPRPFNPSTVIGYALPEAGHVRRAVYNLLWQEVRLPVNERMEAGTFTTTWDGTDERGRRVASGVYLYRMEADGFTATHRMLLLK